MPLDVLSMIRGARRARASELEALAARLFKGEQIPPHDVLRELTDCGGTDEQLQAEIDRLDRVRQLQAQVRAAEPLHAELAKIDAEWTAARDKMQAAATAVAQLQDKHGERHMELRHKIDAAERAMTTLMDPSNLCTADRAALEVAQHEQQRTAGLHSQARQELQMLAHRVTRMQEQLTSDRELLKANPGNKAIRANVQEGEQALSRREAALKDAQVAEAAAGKAAAAADLALTQLMQRLTKGVLR